MIEVRGQGHKEGDSTRSPLLVSLIPDPFSYLPLFGALYPPATRWAYADFGS